MTVEELINELRNYDGKKRVCIAFQPNHPLRADIDCIGTISQDNDDYEDDDQQRKMVFIVADHANGYTAGELWE